MVKEPAHMENLIEATLLRPMGEDDIWSRICNVQRQA